MSLVVIPELEYNALLCRYSEIGTKGKNRQQFENLLMKRIRFVLRGIGELRIHCSQGRIFIRHKDVTQLFTSEHVQILRDNIPRVAGLLSVSPGFMVKPELEAIEDVISQTMPLVYDATVSALSDERSIAYGMRARRSNKKFPMQCRELEIYFAEKMLPKFPRLHINLKKPEFKIEVEVRDKLAFISYERILGPGGLPTASGGRLLALFSGGIDSPVACYQMIRRGCTIDFITFHSEPYTTAELIRNVADLANIINLYQNSGRLIAVNLLEAQKIIRDNCSDRLRTILYRRMMVRISAIVADYIGAQALVTGDNIGQVASQTLENMIVVSQATDKMIMRPVLAYDKVYTMAIAEKIGTFEISKSAVADSCTVFAPNRPATKATLEKIMREEERIDIDELLKISLENSFFIDTETLEKLPMPRLLNRLGQDKNI